MSPRQVAIQDLTHHLFSLAVNDDGPVLGLRVHVHHLANPPPELKEGVAEGVAVARPFRVVELDHLPLLPVLAQPDGPGKQQDSQDLWSQELDDNLIIKFASCSSDSTVMPTPPYTSSLFLAAGQYWTHLRIKSPIFCCISNLHDADEVKGPGDHDDAGGLLLPHHPPEVGHRRLRWALGHDVRLRLDQALGGEATYSFNQLMMSNCLNQIQLVNCVQDQDKKFLDLV